MATWFIYLFILPKEFKWTKKRKKCTIVPVFCLFASLLSKKSGGSADWGLGNCVNDSDFASCSWALSACLDPVDTAEGSDFALLTFFNRAAFALMLFIACPK